MKEQANFWLLSFLVCCLALYASWSTIAGGKVAFKTQQLEDQVKQLREEEQILRLEIFDLQTSIEEKRSLCGTPQGTDPYEFILQSKEELLEWETEWNCHRLPDHSDICVYSNLCYDGANMLFLDPSVGPHTGNLLRNPLSGPESLTNFDWDLGRPSPYPPPLSKYVPYLSTWENNVYAVNPESTVKSVHSVEFLPGGTYFIPSEGIGNEWYDLLAIGNLWESQILNEKLDKHSKLPPIDFAVLRQLELTEWEMLLFLMASQDTTTFLLDSWFDKAHRQLGSSEEWVRKHFIPQLREHSTAPVSDKDIVCMENVVVLSQKPRVFSGIHSATEFRKRLYKFYGVPWEVKGVLDWRTFEIKNSELVVVDIRSNSQQESLANLSQIVELIRYYFLESIIIDNDNMIENLDYILSADVYISVHGVGISNCVFLKPRTTVIEIFPYGIQTPTMQNIAESLDLHYIGIPSWLKGPDTCASALHTEEFHKKCEPLFEKQNALCTLWAKDSCSLPSLYDMEIALISGMDYVGLNINPRVGDMFYKLHSARYSDALIDLQFFQTD